MTAYPLTALPRHVTPREVARADAPRVLHRNTSNLGDLDAAVLIRKTRTHAGYTITGTLADLTEALLEIRADFSTQAVPITADTGYEMVLTGHTTEVDHRCNGDTGLSLDRIHHGPTPHWITYDIDPDENPTPRVFADEAPARLDFEHRLRAAENRHGQMTRCATSHS